FLSRPLASAHRRPDRGPRSEEGAPPKREAPKASVHPATARARGPSCPGRWPPRAARPTAALDLRRERRRGAKRRRQASPLVLQLVPRRHRCQLEQGAAAARIAVAEVGAIVVPGDLEEPFLDAVVEPRAAEDELAQPVDERFAVDERDPF